MSSHNSNRRIKNRRIKNTGMRSFDCCLFRNIYDCVSAIFQETGYGNGHLSPQPLLVKPPPYGGDFVFEDYE